MVQLALGQPKRKTLNQHPATPDRISNRVLPKLQSLSLRNVEGFKAGNGTRTRDFNLGKLSFYYGITRKSLI